MKEWALNESTRRNTASQAVTFTQLSETRPCDFLLGEGNEDGQALIEFAVTVPLLLLVVTGILTFGIALNNYLMLTQATGVAARTLAVNRGQTLDPCSTVATAVMAAGPTLNSSNLTFNIVLNGTPFSGTSCASASTSTGAAGDMVQGTPAKVTVTYPCKLAVYGARPLSSCTLTAQTTEAME